MTGLYTHFEGPSGAPDCFSTTQRTMERGYMCPGNPTFNEPTRTCTNGLSGLSRMKHTKDGQSLVSTHRSQGRKRWLSLGSPLQLPFRRPTLRQCVRSCTPGSAWHRMALPGTGRQETAYMRALARLSCMVQRKRLDLNYSAGQGECYW